MTTEMVVSHQRSWLPVVSLLVAAGAATLGVIGIVADDVATTTPPAAVTRVNDDPAIARAAVAGEPCGLRVRGNLPC